MRPQAAMLVGAEVRPGGEHWTAGCRGSGSGGGKGCGGPWLGAARRGGACSGSRRGLQTLSVSVPPHVGPWRVQGGGPARSRVDTPQLAGRLRPLNGPCVTAPPLHLQLQISKQLFPTPAFVSSTLPQGFADDPAPPPIAPNSRPTPPYKQHEADQRPATDGRHRRRRRWPPHAVPSLRNSAAAAACPSTPSPAGGAASRPGPGAMRHVRPRPVSLQRSHGLMSCGLELSTHWVGGCRLACIMRPNPLAAAACPPAAGASVRRSTARARPCTPAALACAATSTSRPSAASRLSLTPSPPTRASTAHMTSASLRWVQGAAAVEQPC